MNTDAKKSLSFKRLLNYFWVILYLIMLVLYAVTQSIVVGQATNNVEKSIKLSVASSEEAIENSLEMIDLYLYENYYIKSPNALSNLCHTYLNSESEVERSAALGDLGRVVQSIPSWNGNVSFDMMYIIDDEKGIWLDAGESDSYAVRSELKTVIENFETDPENSEIKRYMVYECEGKRYLLRTMRLDKCYFVIGLSQKNIIELLQKAMYSDRGICFAVDENDEVIFTDKPVEGRILFENDGQYVTLGSEIYLQVGSKSDTTGYYFGILTDRKAIISDLLGTIYIFVLVLILMTGLFLVSRVFVARYIERPITEGIARMSEIEKGELDTTVDTNTKISEFGTLADSFNRMVDKIKTLKIEKYESELRTQKATMQYLQLQIKPHFYANLLNIIYSLAQSKDYETIQKVSKAIVNYSRYMFRDATELVELKREMDFLDCFMEIQEIRYRKQVSLFKQVPDNMREALIPPFIIQSFVENSVKYAFSTKKDCQINVSISLSDDRERMIIEVKDNGDGYPDEFLYGDWKIRRIDEHVGLYNVYTRLQIIYEDQADIELSNDNGAKTVITLPYIDMGSADDI